MINVMIKKIKSSFDYFIEEFWDPQGEKRSKNFFYRLLRIICSALRNFLDDNCFDKASTLTFYSLLSIVPLVAIGFGIAQQLGFGEKFTEQIKVQLQGQPEVAQKIIEFANTTIINAQGGWIAGFGVLVLLWTVFRMFGNIETYFDEVWKVKKSRTLWQQASSYVPMIILFPIFLVGSSNLLVFISNQAQSIGMLKIFDPLIELIVQLFSSFVSWMVLSFLYIYIPNAKVYWKSGIISGIVAGILYSQWQWVYVTFQVNTSSYGAIYGSFAAFPLFLIWLNYSWWIILFGTELSVSIQRTK